MITLDQTNLDPDTFEKGVEFDIPQDDKWVTVTQFHNTRESKADKFFLHDHDADEVSEIEYRTFKRTLGEYIGSTVFEALLYTAEEEQEELKSELGGVKLSNITLLEQH